MLGSSNFKVDANNLATYGFRLVVPPLSLHCSNPNCDGTRFFDPSSDGSPIGWNTADEFLDFTCRHCKSTVKTFAVRFTPPLGHSHDVVTHRRWAYKFGEIPQFGPPLSAKLLQLAGDHGPLLKKGRQSENQSLGIGAFSYYRRVVERQKSRLIDELANAIQRLGGNHTAIATLEKARTETRFTQAIEQIADVIPKELYLQGRNPLTLLHGL